MTIIYVLLVAHFVGDFICQTDWMALNKSKRWDALALHIAVYSAVLFGCLWLTLGMRLNTSMWPAAAALGFYIPVNAAVHFVQDAITSRINARLWFLKMTPAVGMWRQIGVDVAREEDAYYVDDLGTRHWFFVAIGFDQLLHYVMLFVTAAWWLS